MRRGLRLLAVSALLAVMCASSARAQDIPRGTIVDEVKWAGNPTQSYALYVPSTYSPDQRWSLLVAFHPTARGRLMVEKYQGAAEQYGYIVAGSNPSRKGPWVGATAAVQAISADLDRRFSIDLALEAILIDESRRRPFGALEEVSLTGESRRQLILLMAREQLAKLSRTANAADESPVRSRARRVLRAVDSGGPARVRDDAFGWLISEYRLREQSPNP